MQERSIATSAPRESVIASSAPRECQCYYQLIETDGNAVMYVEKSAFEAMRAERDSARELANDNAELHEEACKQRDSLRAECENLRKLNKDALTVAYEAQEKLKLAVEGLEFYANKNTWQAYGTQALEDGGTIARSALSQIGGESE